MPTRPEPEDPRSSYAWQQVAATVVREEPICWLGLDGCTIRSDTADHVIGWKEAPQLALVRSNLRGACRHCNSKRGAMPAEALELFRRPPALTFFD